jgi:hypothetical protein
MDYFNTSASTNRKAEAAPETARRTPYTIEQVDQFRQQLGVYHHMRPPSYARAVAKSNEDPPDIKNHERRKSEVREPVDEDRDILFKLNNL